MLLVYLTGAWIGGIAAAALLALPWQVWAWWLLLPIGLLLLWWRDARLRRVHLCLLFFVLAALRYVAVQPRLDAGPLAALNNRSAVAMTGIVIDPPEVGDRWTSIRVAVSRVRTGNQWRDVAGLVLVQAPRETDVRYGDQVQVYGEPITPPEGYDFSYKEWLARQDIHSLVRTSSAGVRVLARDQGHPFWSALYGLRARGVETLQAILPEPAAALAAGILLGDDSGMPRELKDAFSATNTSHIIAISGFNIAVIAGILLKLVQRLHSRAALLLVIPGLVFYTLLVGANPSVVRATIMASLSLFARSLGRTNDGLNALAASALGMTALDPFVLYDLGFQLSFLATLGLILYVEPFTRGFESLLQRVVSGDRARQIVGLLGDSFIVTLAAQVTSTPLIMFAFHRLSTIGLLTNLLILPAQPAVEIWGGLALMAGLLFLPAGQAIGAVAWVFLEWTILVVERTAALPLASIEVGRLDVLWLAAYYIVVIAVPRVDWAAVRAFFAGLGSTPQRTLPTTPQSPNDPIAQSPTHPIPQFLFAPAFALGLGLVLLIWTWNLAVTAPDGKTHVEFLDVGSPATLIRTANGARVLVDGGASPSATLAALGERMPFWERSLDLVVLTDSSDAHLAGLVAALDRYDVRQIVQVGPPARSTAAYSKWVELVASKRVPVAAAQTDLAIALDGNLVLEIVQVDRSGATAAMRLRAGNVTFMWSSSADEKEQAALLDAGIDLSATVLIPPRTLTPEFLDGVNPQIAVLTAGSSSREQPSRDLLSSLAHTTVLRTDEHGAIEMITDGRTLDLRTAR